MGTAAGHMQAPIDTGYLSAFTPNQSAAQGAASVDALMHALTSDERSLTASVGSETLAQCMERLISTGDPEGIELVMNCAAGTDEVGVFAQSLLLKQFSAKQKEPQGQLIQSMAQDLVCKGAHSASNTGLRSACENPTLLLLGASVDDASSEIDSIPPVVRQAVQDLNQAEWRPTWWVLHPPTDKGVFLPSTLDRLVSDCEGVSQSPAFTPAKVVKVAGDGACMFRTCLTVAEGDAEWANASKQEVLDQLEATGWMVRLHESFETAFDSLANVWGDMEPLAALVKAMDADTVLDLTVRSKRFDYYSPQGLARALGAPASQEEMEFLEILADAWAERFLSSVDMSTIVSQGGKLPDSAGKGAWPLHDRSGVHYDVLVTKDFLKTSLDPQAVLGRA